jgi:hypothetical protein
VRGGERAEQLGEGDLRVVVEVVLPAEEQHLVLEEGRAHLGDGVVVEVTVETDTVDDGADAAADLADLDCRALGKLDGHADSFRVDSL